MTISSDELNYLIWRYLQEQGLEVSLFALKDETSIDKYDNKYSESIPLGCLINLIQKGILYCEEEDLVDMNGNINTEMAQKFNLFDALEKDKLTNPTTDIQTIDDTSFITMTSTTTTNNRSLASIDKLKEVSPASSTDSSSFTSVLINSFTFPKSQTTSWNPRSSAVLAWGQRDNSSIIAVLDDSKDNNDHLKLLSTLKLEHPNLTLSSSAYSQLQPHSNDITLLKWSTNGDMLLTASEVGELRLWTTDGKLKNVMMLHNSPIITIKWLNDLILTKDQTRTIVWDSKTGLALLHLEDSQGGIDCCFIDESKIAVPSLDFSISIYDFVNSTSSTNTPISKLHGHTDNISFMEYSNSLKLLMTVSDDLTIRIWKGDSINPTQIIWAHSQLITSCNWLPLDEFVVPNIEMLISTSLDGSVRIWNIYTADLLFIGINSVSILQAEVSPNNHWLATADVDGIVTVWDISILALNKSYEKAMAADKIVAGIQNKSQYQPEQEVDGNFISCINWSEDSTKIAVSYSEIDSVVLYV